MEWHIYGMACGFLVESNGMGMQISRHFFQDNLKLREIFIETSSVRFCVIIFVCVKSPQRSVTIYVGYF